MRSDSTPELLTSEQRKELEAQFGRLVAYAHGHLLVAAVSEVGSAWNGRRAISQARKTGLTR